MTPPERRPFVVHVDDDPDQLNSWRLLVARRGRIDLEVHHPNAIRMEHLERAELVLVDFALERWPERDRLDSIALKPSNGIALLSLLKEALSSDATRRRPAFALYTAVIQDVAMDLVQQPHVVAHAHNIEWIFQKTHPSLELRAEQVENLASTIMNLPHPWPADSSSEAASTLRTWLGIDGGESWHDAAWSSVRRCRPPMHEYAQHTDGLALVRWLLHRILPYPAFLIGEEHLAARLRVSLPSLKAALPTEAFAKIFEPVEFRNGLTRMSGRRWWRAGVEDAVFEIARTAPQDLDTLHRELKERLPELEPSPEADLFPVLSEQLDFEGELANGSEIVEILPDYWPPFADCAWTRKSVLANSSHLRTIAVGQQEGE